MEKTTIEQRLDRIEQLLVAQKEVLTVDDVAQILGTTKNNIYRMTHERTIPFYKPQNGKIYFKRTEIEQWQLRNRKASVYETKQQAAKYCVTY